MTLPNFVPQILNFFKDKSMSIRKLFLLFVLSAMTIVKADNYKTLIKVAKHKIYVEIADTEDKRATGMMYRKSMPDSCGMLFIHDYPEELFYWMKNTYIPLSIAFLDSKGIIVSIKDMKPHDLTSVGSDYPALYSLETNKGWFKKHKIKVGDKVEF